MEDIHLQFYRELMGSLCQTMMYDIFEAHTRRDAADTHTDRTAYIVKQLMDLLGTGISRTEREVKYYADRLHVSPKYRSATIKRVTGLSVTSVSERVSLQYSAKTTGWLTGDTRLDLLFENIPCDDPVMGIVCLAECLAMVQDQLTFVYVGSDHLEVFL